MSGWATSGPGGGPPPPRGAAQAGSGLPAATSASTAAKGPHARFAPGSKALHSSIAFEPSTSGPGASICYSRAAAAVERPRRSAPIVQRTRFPRRPVALAARTLSLAAALAARPAAAETVVQVDAVASVGYSDTSGEQSDRHAFTQIGPALTLQFQSPRLTWRAGYLFAGNLTVGQDRVLSYANQVVLALGAELSSRSNMVVTANVAQGGTAFQLTQRSADAGEPTFRSRANPDLVAAELAQAYALEVSPQSRFGQSLGGALVAPQDALGSFNASMTGSLSLDRELRNEFGAGPRDAVGAELRAGGAFLRSSELTAEPSWSIRNALVARWNHDFTWRWNGQATAGVEQVLTFAGSYPLAVLPTGSFTARYLTRDGGASLGFTYGSAADLQTGTLSLSEGVVARAFMSFDSEYPSQLGLSAGFVHAKPLGQAPARAAAGTGNAAQGDVGIAWGLGEGILATARYSVAYQFDQPNGLEPMLTRVFLVGLTMRYSNARRMPPAPALGARVDGSDRVGFPEGGSARP
jgi:hypothetical protein